MYTTATLVQKDPPGPDGRVALTIEFTGTGETPQRRGYMLDGQDTAATVKAWAIAEAGRLNGAKTIASNLTVGQSVSLVPASPPAPTAEQVWRSKVSRYQQLAPLGLAGQAATDLAALKSDIETTYVSTYL